VTASSVDDSILECALLWLLELDPVELVLEALPDEAS
jgi:hypothetical protein